MKNNVMMILFVGLLLSQLSFAFDAPRINELQTEWEVIFVDVERKLCPNYEKQHTEIKVFFRNDIFKIIKLYKLELVGRYREFFQVRDGEHPRRPEAITRGLETS